MRRPRTAPALRCRATPLNDIAFDNANHGALTPPSNFNFLRSIPRNSAPDARPVTFAEIRSQHHPAWPATVGPCQQASWHAWLLELDERTTNDEHCTRCCQTRRATTLDQQAQSVATRSVAMMLRGHHPQPNPPRVVNGRVAILPTSASRRDVREWAPWARALGGAEL